MKTKHILHRYFYFALLVLLTSCQSAPTATPTLTLEQTAFPPSVVPSTQTEFVTSTPFAETPSPTATKSHTESSQFTMSEYVMVFPRDDGIYFQDGEKPPFRLTYFNFTNDPKPYNLVLSDDLKKVAFSSGYVVESIDTDGAEQLRLLLQVDSAKPDEMLGALAFIPNTHQLLIEIMRCEFQEPKSLCSVSLHIADTDSGETRELAYIGLADQKGRRPIRGLPQNIKISPDGNMIAVGTMSGITLYGLDGKIIRKHILPYESISSQAPLPRISWLPDSSGLFVAIPDSSEIGNNGAIVPTSSIWRIMVDSDNEVQISIDPSPKNNLQFSPDGKWIFYSGANSPYVYIGNLSDGHIQQKLAVFSLYEQFFFGPQTRYFFARYGDGEGGYLGEFDTTSGIVSETYYHLTPDCFFKEWIDVSHYLCETSGKIVMAEINGSTISTHDLNLDEEAGHYVEIKPKTSLP